MRKNHHGKKDRLVKRVFALCLALAVICTCLVPVFATEGGWIATQELDASTQVATMDTAFGVDDGYGIDTQETDAAASTSQSGAVVDSGSTSDSTSSGSTSASTSASTSTSESTASSTTGTSEVITDPSTITDVKIPDGATNIVKNANGSYSYTTEYGRITVFPTKEGEKTTWTDDEVTITPNPNLKEDDAAFGVLPIEYHFWLKQLDSDTFRELDWEAEMAEMSETEYLALFGASEKFPIWHMDTIASTDTISNYKFVNPTAKDDPAGEGREFAYWYTVDENGVESEFNPYKTYGSETATVVNVYAKWKDASGDVVNEDTTKEETTTSGETKANPVEVSAKANIPDYDGEVTVTVTGLPSNVTHLSVTSMGDNSMQSFYELYSSKNKNSTMMPLLGYKISPKNAKGETVQPAKGQKATVTVSGLDKLPEMEGATADTLKVLHETSDGSVETLDVLTYANGTLTFETSSFSPFVVVRTDGYAVNTLDINNITDVSIKDDIANSGHYVLNITVDGKDYEGEEAGKLLKKNGFTVTWKKGGTVVDRYEVTNGVYSREENGGWVDVVYTDGANLTYTVTIAKDTQSRNASLTVNYNDELKNGGFEDVHSNGTDQIDADAASNLVWKTTAMTGGQHKIEIGNTEGMTSFYELQANGDKWDNVQLSNTAKAYGCAKANAGVQFAELNAEGAGALYQDVLTKPGQPMNWRFYHRARTRRGDANQSSSVIQSGSDTMAMVIAPLELVKDVTTQAQLESLLGECTNHNGENYITKNKITYTVYVYQATATINDLSGTRKEQKTGAWGYTYWVNTYQKYSTSSWTESSGTYKIPDGQYLTRFFFAAISTASGNSEKAKTMGNLLDDVWFSQNVAPPTSGTGRVTVTKKFYGLTEAEAKTLGNSGFISYDQSVVHRGIADQALTAVDFSGDIWTNGYDDENGPYVSVSHVFDEVVEANTDYTYYFAENVNKADVNGYKLTKTLVDGVEGTTGSVTMNKEHSNKSITFSNFYKKNTTDVTITKQVTGLLGDTNKDFEFRVSITQNDTACTGVTATKKTETVSNPTNFTLKHNETVTLENVPIGATIKVTEVTPGAHYKVSATGQNGEKDGSSDVAFTYVAVANTATAGNADEAELMLLSMDEDTAVDADGDAVAYDSGIEVDNNQIIVTNHCGLIPDTGVLLDTLPYIVILAVVAGGVALLMLRKHRKEDD